jgi:phosphonoacetaldehyde hydrolase
MKIQAIVMDWAGTTIDFGSQAPVAAIRQVFEAQGVPVSSEEARAYMGLPKRDHIRATCAMPAVAARWKARHGGEADERAVEALYAEFIPRQISCLEDHSELIPGVAEAVARFRARGIRIGSTTGYTRAMLDVLMERAAAQGYRPDAAVTPEDVGAGRPAPFMCFENAIRLRVYPLRACVKIGDTPSDIDEGRNAGMWTIGITATGNEAGLTRQEWEAMPGPARAAAEARAKERLLAAGADFIAASVADCDPILDEIERRLSAGG